MSSVLEARASGWARSVARLALRIAAGAIALELLATLVLPAPPRDRAPLVRVAPHPTLGYRLVPEQETFSYEAPVRTDARGLRILEATASSSAARRLLFVGGSETFGKGVRAPQTFAARAARALGPGWVALDAGTPDWNVEQSVRFVEREAAPLDPAVVVLALYCDDLFADASTSTSRPAAPSRGEWFLRRWARDSGALEVLAPVYTRSRVLYALRNLAKEAVGRARGLPAITWRDALLEGDRLPGLEGAWRDAQAALSRLAAWRDEHAVDVWVLVLPMEQQDPQGPFHFQARAARLASAAGLPVVDATDAVLAGEGSFIPYDGRPSEAGHARIAEALSAALAEAYQQAP